ncbi:MAG: 50S ribosomal protein L6 [Flavobacteriales bacterium]|jgi:large subunit ribosomal protein L6
MSRIGNAIITIPEGVTISVDNSNVVTVKGKNGELSQLVHPEISIKNEEGILSFERSSDQKDVRAAHGLYRSLVNNMITGVTEGYKKQLELVGVGFRATTNGQLLELALGFSHPIIMEIPKEVKVSAETVKGKPPVITLESHDKQLVGQVAAKIRSFRKPEPYKGKGVKFVGEQLRRKAGKSAAK